MTVFGRTLSPEELASLAAMLAVLVLWLGALGRERAYGRWFKQWEAERKARRDAELANEAGAAPPGDPKGPWG